MHEKQYSFISYHYSSCGTIWVTASFLSALGTLVSLFFPYWIVGKLPTDQSSATFGLFHRCNYYVFNSDGVSTVSECGRYRTFNDIPHDSWRIAVIVMLVAGSLAVLISCVGILASVINYVLTNTLMCILTVAQCFVAILLAVACACYPTGWGSNDVRQICGQRSQPFNLGDCTLGWAYYLACMTCVLTFVCVFLSCFALKDVRANFTKETYRQAPDLFHHPEQRQELLQMRSQ